MKSSRQFSVDFSPSGNWKFQFRTDKTFHSTDVMNKNKNVFRSLQSSLLHLRLEGMERFLHSAEVMNRKKDRSSSLQSTEAESKLIRLAGFLIELKQ